MAGASVSIRFEGVMTFVERPDQLEVLIPNSERAAMHVDGTEAIRHFAWLTDIRPGTKKAECHVREALIGCDITAAAGEGCPGRASSLQSKLFDMGEILRVTQKSLKKRPTIRRNPLGGGKDEAAVSCRIRLYGGRMVFEKRLATAGARRSRNQPRDYVLHYGGDRPMRRPIDAGVPVWTCQVTNPKGLALRIKMREECWRTIWLAPNSEHTISNLDFRTPEEYDGNDRGLRNQLEDGDFRWYYHLFAEPLSTWTALRTVARMGGRRVLGPLPVPVLDIGPREKLSPEEITSLYTQCKGSYVQMR